MASGQLNHPAIVSLGPQSSCQFVFSSTRTNPTGLHLPIRRPQEFHDPQKEPSFEYLRWLFRGRR